VNDDFMFGFAYEILSPIGAGGNTWLTAVRPPSHRLEDWQLHCGVLSLQPFATLPNDFSAHSDFTNHYKKSGEVRRSEVGGLHHRYERHAA